MKTNVVLSAFLLVVLSACGPIIGQMMKAGEGISEFEVVQGSLANLPSGSQLLVYGPFAKTKDAFYISRGEDAANFAGELQDQGLFETRLFLQHDFDRLEETGNLLRSKDLALIRAETGVEALPEVILFGTILHRRTIIAPARGVVMEVAFRLEFYDTASGGSTILEVSVKDLAQACIPKIVKEIARRRLQKS